jgi:hypothetical protein
MHIYDKIKILLRMINCFSQNCGENKICILCSKNVPENRGIYELIWKNMVEPEMTQMTIHNGVCVLHAGLLKLGTRTLNKASLVIIACNDNNC